MRSLSRRTAAAAVLLAFLSLPACNNDSQEPENGGTLGVADIPGDYAASSLIITQEGGGSVDVIAAGGVLQATLGVTGNVTGGLDVPAGVLGPEPVSVEFAGTWSFSAVTHRVTVTLEDPENPAAVVFSVPLVLGGTPSNVRLNGQGTADGTTVDVTLLKQN